jgi:hypothetical protein
MLAFPTVPNRLTRPFDAIIDDPFTDGLSWPQVRQKLFTRDDVVAMLDEIDQQFERSGLQFAELTVTVDLSIQRIELAVAKDIDHPPSPQAQQGPNARIPNRANTVLTPSRT